MWIGPLDGDSCLINRRSFLNSVSSDAAGQQQAIITCQQSAKPAHSGTTAAFRRLFCLWHSSFSTAFSRSGRKGLTARLEALALGVRRTAYIEDLDVDQLCTRDHLFDRGWSVEAMIRLLGRPDYAIIDPHGRRDPIIVLDRRRVIKIENSRKFRAMMDLHRREAEAQASHNAKWAAFRKQISRN